MNDIIDKLIPALIQVESGGNPNAVGDNGEAVGILQIHKCVVDDVDSWHRPSMYGEGSRWSPESSISICIEYLSYYKHKYEVKTLKPATFEVLARIWNGGPNGWKKKSTKSYWLKVKAKLEKQK